jgi:hypothetical protein
MKIGAFFCTHVVIADDNYMGKPEGKRPLGRHRRRWKDSIKKGQEIGYGRKLD